MAIPRPGKRSALETHWFIRITDKDNVLRERFVEFFNGYSPVKALALAHEGAGKENPHYHIAIEFATGIKIDTLRKQILSAFPECKGNKGYAMERWDTNVKVLSYLFHEETNDIVLNKGYSDSDLEEFRKKNTETKVAYAQAKSSSIFAHVQNMCVAHDNYNPEFIIREYFRECVKQEKLVPSKFQMKRMIDTILAKHDIDDAARDMFNELYPSRNFT